MKTKLAFVAAVSVVFIAADWLQETLLLLAPYKGLYQRFPFYVSEGLKSLLQCGMVILAVSLLNRTSFAGSLRELGLWRSPQIGLLFAFAATLPLWIVLAVVSPLAEEMVYRGLAFGQLRRRAGWGFWPAALLPAAIFGWGHAEGIDDLGGWCGTCSTWASQPSPGGCPPLSRRPPWFWQSS